MTLTSKVNKLPKHTKITLSLLLIFAIFMLPPLPFIIMDSNVVWGGWPAMYVWIAAASFWAFGMFVYAAYHDALGIGEDQGPPELRGEIPGEPDSDDRDTAESGEEVIS